MLRMAQAVGGKRKRAASTASERGRERERDLRDLGGVGAATQRDLSWLGITTVSQLRTCDHLDLYNRLNMRYKAARARGEFVGVNGLGPELDACVKDTLECAIAQALDPELPAEQRRWWWWSARRKQAEAAAKAQTKKRAK